MKYLWVWILLFWFPGQAVAVNATADQQASCNASFHEGCKSDQTFTTSSSGFAAPAGVLGSSGLESALMTLLIAGGIVRRLYRARSAGRQKDNSTSCSSSLNPASRELQINTAGSSSSQR